MKKLLLLGLLIATLTSCGTRGIITKKKDRRSTRTERVATRVDNDSKELPRSSRGQAAVTAAKKYLGTPYKYGGTTGKGMDCSGVMLVAYDAVDYQLPRVSREQAKKGKRIKKSKARPGDLVFFRTNKNSRNINHVGMVVTNEGGTLSFIHASSSKGVTISKLTERYWKNAFVEVRTLL